MKNAAEDEGNTLVILLAIPLFLFEIFLVILAAYDLLSLFVTLLIQILVILITLIYLLRCYRMGQDLRYPLLLSLSTATGGPFGLFGFLLFTLLSPLFRERATSPEQWLGELFAMRIEEPFARIYRRIQSGWDDYGELSELTSFQDIFTYGTLSQKQAVLDAIVKDYKPSYAPILKKALEDPSNTLRLQAAAVIAKIDQEFETDLQRLLKIYEENPENQSLLFKIASEVEKIASSGILDETRKKERMDEALTYYRRYLERMPQDRLAHLSIGRLLFQMEDHESFLQWYDDFVRQFKILPGIVEAWYEETLYRLKRYDLKGS